MNALYTHVFSPDAGKPCIVSSPLAMSTTCGKVTGNIRPLIMRITIFLSCTHVYCNRTILQLAPQYNGTSICKGQDFQAMAYRVTREKCFMRENRREVAHFRQ